MVVDESLLYPVYAYSVLMPADGDGAVIVSSLQNEMLTGMGS